MHRKVHDFKNGYSLSIIAGEHTYSTPRAELEHLHKYDEVECGILRNGSLICHCQVRPALPLAVQEWFEDCICAGEYANSVAPYLNWEQVDILCTILGEIRDVE